MEQLHSEFYTKEGKNIDLKFHREIVEGIPENIIDDWHSILEAVYIKCGKLIGALPYEGKVIPIVSEEIYEGHFAHAGLPIKIQKSLVRGVLNDFESKGDWSFGVLHEIGHDFASHIGFDLGERWNWSEEMFANFRMYYAVEQLNGAVINGQLYRGGQLENFYMMGCSDNYYKTIYPRNYVHHDAVMYTLLRIKNKIGWEPFKLTFADLYKKSNSYLLDTSREKFIFFLDKLSEYSNEDVKNIYPDGEILFIENGLS